MYFGEDITQLAIYAMIAVAVAGVVLAIIYPMLSGGTASRRVKAIAENSKVAAAPKTSWKSRLFDDAKESSRKQFRSRSSRSRNARSSARSGLRSVRRSCSPG